VFNYAQGEVLMPYVDGNARERLQAGGVPENAGELNYLISLKVNEYLSQEGIRYSHINDVVGVLEYIKLDLYNATPTAAARSRHQGLEELRTIISQLVDDYVRRSEDRLTEAFGVLQCAMFEFYRRVAAPYEDKKIREHGDVYCAGV
jgi:hypothetical protein